MTQTTIHVRCRPELKKKIKEAAARMGTSESNYIRMKAVEALGLKPELAFAPQTKRP